MDVKRIAIDPTYNEKTLKCSVCGKHRIDQNNNVDTSFFRSPMNRDMYFCSRTCHRKITPKTHDHSDRQAVADLFS